MKEKTHIMWNPNKNYLGSWDLPKSGDLVLTIDKICWEEIENPQDKKEKPKQKRIVHFVEDFKPMICNEENANAIMLSTDVKFIEEFDGEGKKIAIFPFRGRFFGEEMDVLRVRPTSVAASTREKENAMESLELCTTMEELSNTYINLGKEKNDPEVVACKDAMKIKLQEK